ncbi:MAG: SHOCT domain-containing protein [Acidimicrobiia bacterium]
MVAAEWGTGQVFWSMVWFFLFFIWIWLLITVFADIFRSRDMGGGAKTLWVLFVILMPYLGVFVYLIARGHKMGEHAAEDVQRQQDYIRAVAGTQASSADELEKLAGLRDRGVITAQEFEAQKARILAG